MLMQRDKHILETEEERVLTMLQSLLPDILNNFSTLPLIPVVQKPEQHYKTNSKR